MNVRPWAVAAILAAAACNEVPAPRRPQHAVAPPASASLPEPDPPAPAASASAAAPTPAARERAAQVLAWLEAGEFGKVRALFDEQMNGVTPTDQALGKLWGAIGMQLGKYQRTIETVERDDHGFHVVLMTCMFENLPVDLQIAFDPEGKIGGFTVVPTSNPNAFGARPQTPKPPFEFDAREVEYDNAPDGSHFAGTLTTPKQVSGPFAAVLLITGSGVQDRDETIFGHKPFLVIADRLTRAGIAVLRVDDPGTGGSTGDVASATLDTHARDVEAGIAFLKGQKDIDAKRIGLVGHSEGGLLAAMVASRSKDVAFVASLAGTGLPGKEINPTQIEAILRAQGRLKDDAIAAIVAEQRKLMALIAKDADAKAIDKQLQDTFDVAMKYAASDEEKAIAQQEMAAASQMLASPWFKSFVKLDPAAYWSKVTVPALLMNGEKDTQVVPEPNLKAIQAALKKAKNADVTVEKLAGLNHLFQPAKTGLLDEYASVQTTMDPRALDALTLWAAAHAGLVKKSSP